MRLQLGNKRPKLISAFATNQRNLGIAYWNVRGDAQAARAAYQQAIANNPNDARIIVEYDQLCEKCGDKAADRLAYLNTHSCSVSAA